MRFLLHMPSVRMTILLPIQFFHTLHLYLNHLPMRDTFTFKRKRRSVSKGGGMSSVDTARRGNCAQNVARLRDVNDGFILRTGI